MSPAHVDLDEDIFESGVPILFVDVVHATGNVEKGDHLFNVGVHRERVSFAGRFEHVIAGASDPIVFQISPGSLDHIAVYGGRMAMPAQNAGSANTQEIAPLAVQRIQHQRPKPDVRGLWNPDAFIFGDGASDDLVR
jgi:hypothetical protein